MHRSRLILLIAYIIFITILFCLPGTAFPIDNWMDRIQLDKWIHIGIFSVLMILAGRCFQPENRKWLIIISSAAVYGFLIEIMQDTVVEHRSFDLGDWVADLIGIMTGVLIFRRYAKK